MTISSKTKLFRLSSLMLCLRLSAIAQPVVNGFVTTKPQNNMFQVGTARIRWTNQTKCFQAGQAQATVPCSTLDLSVGVHIQITGSQRPDGTIVATMLALESRQNSVSRRALPWLSDKRSGGPSNGMLEGGAYLEEAPKPIQSANITSVSLWLNGFPIEANNATLATLAPAAEAQRAVYIGGPKAMAGYFDLKTSATATRLSPLSDNLRPGMYVSYRAITEANGSLLATSLTIFPDIPAAREYAFRISFTPAITEPNYKSHIPGKILREHGDPIKILPDQAIQDYVQSVGFHLILAYQNELPFSSDPTKVHPRFYVVHSFRNDPSNTFIAIDGGPPPSYNGQSKKNNLLVLPHNKASVDRVVETPDGVVLIPDVVLSRLRNTAQLSFILSAAIQAIIQKQAYLAEALWKQTDSSYYDVFWQNQRSIRMGIHQMYLAGYDIREAPFAWAFERAEPLSNPLVDPKSTRTEIPWYAAYAFDYISKYYSAVDYAKLKRGEAEYRQFLKDLRVADPEAFVDK